EELLIGNNFSGTDHPGIMRAEEDFLPWNELESLLNQLATACERLDCTKAREVLLSAVAGYSPTNEVEDLVWRERNVGVRVVLGAKVTPLEPRRGGVAHIDRPHSGH